MKIAYSQCQNITFGQIENMKHAIGFSNNRVRGTKYRKYVPYRNYYDSGVQKKDSLDRLVELGLMSHRELDWGSGQKNNVYHVTEDGREFIGMVTGVEILPETK